MSRRGVEEGEKDKGWPIGNLVACHAAVTGRRRWWRGMGGLSERACVRFEAADADSKLETG
jgi:hypothetical protein